MRHLGPSTLASILFLSFGLAVCEIAIVPPAPAQTAHPKLLRTSKSSTPVAPKTPAPELVLPVAPPGSALYVAKRGDSIPLIARRYLAQTSYLTSTELGDAIHKANGDLHGTFLKAGQPVIVPGLLLEPIVEKSIPVERDFEVRAVYLTGLMAASDRGIGIIRRWREVGGNAVVFDIKDSDGKVTIPFDHPLLGSHHSAFHDLPKFIRFLHSQNMHAIARVAIFRDQRLVETHPELAVKSHKTGQPWRENGKLVWTDPSQLKVQEYDIALAKQAAEAGADEIQFDYVRFPAEGDQKDASFVFQTEHPEWHRSDVIGDFLKHAYAQLHPTGALLSLDVFGIMAWQRPVDLAHTGQDIVRMAKNCDVLSPMIYPSHFFGMDGIAHPGDAPEHFIGESMVRFESITKGSGVVVRPWLQAFRWRTKTYSPKYIEVQVQTAKDKGGIGFLFWNAANDYSKPYVAMPEMRAAKGQYFRGDELPGGARASVATATAPDRAMVPAKP
ncbi:MAG TPA: putative glycoside hydrolase [Terriglobales bacterium]|nr:putative glycoside hydrolase [Terriglobales bacterium]